MDLRTRVLAVATALALSACGGTKLARNAAPPPLPPQPLATAGDTHLAAGIDWVIVRNGPGAWAKNADWDEYLLRVQNPSAAPVRIDAIRVTDSRGYAAASLADRTRLVKASKATVKRYRASGLKVVAGRGGGTLLAAGAGATVVGYGLALGEAYGAILSGGAAAGSSSVGAVAGGLILAGPVLVGMGIVRAVNNSKVGNRIERRASALPQTLAAGEAATLDMFFPVSPSPQHVTIHYHDATGDHQLQIDTSQALAGLHLPVAAQPAQPTPAMP